MISYCLFLFWSIVDWNYTHSFDRDLHRVKFMFYTLCVVTTSILFTVNVSLDFFPFIFIYNNGKFVIILNQITLQLVFQIWSFIIVFNIYIRQHTQTPTWLLGYNFFHIVFSQKHFLTIINRNWITIRRKTLSVCWEHF